MRAIVLLSLVVVSSPSQADSWIPATVKVYESADHASRVTVVPRKITKVLDYFQDKVAGKEPTGAPDGSKVLTATVIMESRDASGKWENLWSKPLVNEVAPLTCF